MTSSDNGRLTRTIVNRLWDRLMGAASCSRSTRWARRPWSEDLLDYLAVDLADRGYDLKQTLELIATSQVYGSESVAVGSRRPGRGICLRRPGAEADDGRAVRRRHLADDRRVARRIRTTTTIFGEMLYYAPGGEAARPFVRASLVESTLLMRTLGRPNREQVVTTRPAEMTTLEAIEMSNGQPLAELLAAGGRQAAGGSPRLVGRGNVPLMSSNRPSRAAYRRRIGNDSRHSAGTPLDSGRRRGRPVVRRDVAGVSDWCDSDSKEMPLP